MSREPHMTEKQLQIAVLSFVLFSFATDCWFIWLILKSIWGSMNDDIYFQAQVIKTCLVGIFLCVLFAKFC